MAALRDREPLGTRADWRIWGVDASLVVDRPDALSAALGVAEGMLAQVTAACSRFEQTSELSRLHGDRRLAEGVEVSPLLAELVAAALRVAAETEGSVDPTVGADLARWGYDRDFDALPPHGEHDEQVAPDAGFSVTVNAPREPGWRRVRLVGRRLSMPEGTVLDLGATAKAFTADRIAERIAGEFDTGVLVSLGGDLASAGTPAVGGWEVLVQDLDDSPAQQVFLPAGSALATSSTQKRRWRHDGRNIQHIFDPAFGTPVVPEWGSVTVAARSCLRANALSTAAIVRGRGAAGWLAEQGADARLVDLVGRVITVGSWPRPADAVPEPVRGSEPVRRPETVGSATR